jgi:hypothetical protein
VGSPRTVTLSKCRSRETSASAFTVCGKSDEVVVLLVVWDHAWWIDWIIERDAFVGEAVRKAVRLLPGDVVLLGDPRMQQSLSDLVNELRADDQIDLALLPQRVDQGRPLPVDLLELEAALDDDSWQHSWYLHRETGRVVLVTDEDRRLLEDLHGEGRESADLRELTEDQGVPTWQREAVQDAKAIGSDDGSRYLTIPRAEHWEGYGAMEDFIATVKDSALADRLASSIRGRGAFGRFRDVLAEHPDERHRWHRFQTEVSRRGPWTG